MGVKKGKAHTRGQLSPSATSVGTNLKDSLMDRGTDIFNDM